MSSDVKFESCDKGIEEDRITEYREDIFEEDARGREVWELANGLS